MCGLVGVAGYIDKVELNALSKLMIINAWRGSDSTGIAFVGDTFNDIYKSLGGPFQLWEEHNKKLDKHYIQRKERIDAVIVHGRAATIGSVNINNAHPFETNRYIGCHNGTIEWNYIPKIDNISQPHHLTDSERCILSFEEKGIKETIKDLKGAWAFVVWDKQTKRLYIVRNDERTLFYCMSKDAMTMFWSSEINMLRCVLDRGEKASGTYSVDDQIGYKPFDINTLYTFDFSKKEIQVSTEPCKSDPKVILPYTTPYYQETKREKGPTKEGEKVNPFPLPIYFSVTEVSRFTTQQQFKHCLEVCQDAIYKREKELDALFRAIPELYDVSEMSCWSEKITKDLDDHMRKILWFENSLKALSTIFGQFKEAANNFKEKERPSRLDKYATLGVVHPEFSDKQFIKYIKTSGCASCGTRRVPDPKAVYVTWADDFVCVECAEKDSVYDNILSTYGLEKEYVWAAPSAAQTDTIEYMN